MTMKSCRVVVALAVVAATLVSVSEAFAPSSLPKSPFGSLRAAATDTQTEANSSFDEYDPLSQTQTEVAYKDVLVGDGPGLEEGQVATIAYTGRLMSTGKQFDQGPGYTFRVGDGRVVPGWEKGLKVSTQK